MLQIASISLTDATNLKDLFANPNYTIVNERDGSTEPSLLYLSHIKFTIFHSEIIRSLFNLDRIETRTTCFINNVNTIIFIGESIICKNHIAVNIQIIIENPYYRDLSNLSFSVISLLLYESNSDSIRVQFSPLMAYLKKGGGYHIKMSTVILVSWFCINNMSDISAATHLNL